MSLLLDSKLCIRCGCCIAACPANIFSGEASCVVVAKEASERYCVACGHCVAICPEEAITLNGMPSENLLPVSSEPLSEAQTNMFFKSRRSVRTFKPEPVPRDSILAALEDARYAPTVMNKQEIEWIVLEGRKNIYELGQRVAHNILKGGGPYATLAAKYSPNYDPIFRKAPMLIMAHAPADCQWRIQDATIAATTLDLSLHNRGLGVIWAGFFMRDWKSCAANNEPVPMVLPEGRTLEAALMVGVPVMQYARIPLREPVRVQFI